MHLLKKPSIQLLSKTSSLLILAAPIVVEQINCAFLWGEPEVPDCLNPNK